MLTKKEAFITALMADDYKALEQLLAEGFSPNLSIHICGSMGRIIKTPIHLARSPETIALLLRFGADPNRSICYDEVINRSYQSLIYYRVHRLYLRRKPFYSENIMALLCYQPFLIDTLEVNRTLNHLIFAMMPGEPLQEYQRMLIRSSADLAKKVYGKHGSSPLKYAQRLTWTEMLSAMVCHNFHLYYQIMTGRVKHQLTINVYEECQQSDAAKLMRILAIWPFITVLYGEASNFPQELVQQIKYFIVAELDLQYQPECPFIFKYLNLAALMPIFERVYTLLDNSVLHLHKKRGFDNNYSPIFFEKVMDSTAEKKPYGRKGFAWHLSKKYRHECCTENSFFMQEVRFWFKKKKGFKKFSLKPQQEKILEVDEKKEDSLSSS